MAGLDRNQWPACIGITGRLASEYAPTYHQPLIQQVIANAIRWAAVVDISNPASPVIVGSVTSGQLNGAFGVVVAGSYAYVTASTSDRLTVLGTP